MPDPVPLEMPPGNAEGLTDVVQDVAGAGFHFTFLAGSLAGPAASAPGWLGNDAIAAAEQVGVTATLAQRTAEAVVAAMHRLSAHAECLHEARRRVAALEREQEEDFRATWVQLSQVGNPVLAVRTGAEGWVGPIEDLRAAEEARRRRHAAVLEEVAEDAAATARVLADSCAAMGGRGAPGDAERVLAYFAAELPGWGDQELSRRGRALAATLIDTWRIPGEKGELSRHVLAMAGSAAFAEAFLLELGEEGLRAGLVLLGDGDSGADSPLAQLLVSVLGAGGTTGFPDEVEAVVRAPYVDSSSPGVTPDDVVLGMAVVLAAAATRRTGSGLPPATVAAWGRQIIRREHVQGAAAVDRAQTWGAHPEVDAVPLVVDLLSRGGDSGQAAGLLAGRDVWSVLLARTWHHDCGAGLAGLVSLAGSDSGPDGGAALRAGLEALGTGLADGDPDGWTVSEAAAAAVRRPLAEGLAVHWAVPAGILAAGADGETSGRDGDRLRGLGYLTIDQGAAAVVRDAVTTWVAHQPPGVTATVTATDLAIVAVPAAYVAVQEYGQRLAYTLDAFERQAAAEDRRLRWDMTLGLVAEIAVRRFGAAVGVAEPIAALLFDADGGWEGVPDRGDVFGPEDASAAAGGAAPWHPAILAAMARQAHASFEGTAETLGRLEPPMPPSSGERWWAAVLDAAGGLAMDRVELDDLRKAWRGGGS